ncbi:MAG: hypothetical protein AAF957_17240 [Planctomycetota bacterium]
MIDRRLSLSAAGLLSLLTVCVALIGTRSRPELDRSTVERANRAMSDLPVRPLETQGVAGRESPSAGPRSMGAVEPRRSTGHAPISPRAARGLDVAVHDREGRPVPGVEVMLERRGDSGAWLEGSVARSDDGGRARLRGLLEGEVHRVGATFPGAPAPVEVRSTDPVALSIDRPRRAVIELRSRLGHRLTGARSVGLSAGLRSLDRRDTPAQWEVLLSERIDATVHVTDSLGRPWSADASLVPGATTVVSPGPEWIAIARTEPSGAVRRAPAERARLRWSLRQGDRSARRGSGWVAPGGGFHAVFAKDTSRAKGGLLELRWTAADGERSVQASWHPDPTLEHIALNASPIGELIAFPSINFQRP